MIAASDNLEETPEKQQLNPLFIYARAGRHRSEQSRAGMTVVKTAENGDRKWMQKFRDSKTIQPKTLKQQDTATAGDITSQADVWVAKYWMFVTFGDCEVKQRRQMVPISWVCQWTTVAWTNANSSFVVFFIGLFVEKCKYSHQPRIVHIRPP